MRNFVLILLLAVATAAASAQTPAKPATTPAKSATAAKPIAKTATTSAKTAAPADKLPAGLTALAGPKTTLYSMTLRYQDEKAGDGDAAEPGKMLKFHYTIWTAGENGVKLDSSHDHPGQPVKDSDGKPVMGEDGKPKLGEPQPVPVIMGQGRPLPGWDMGVEGMKASGKRRIFIPWQLGFGAHEIPARDATHPAIPAKSDLIVDLELVSVSEPPQPPQRPAMGPGMHPPMGAGAPHPMPGAPGAQATPGATPAAPTPPTPAPAAPAPAAPATPAPPAAAPPAQPQSK